MMFSESRNDRNRRRAAADHLRDRDNVAGIGDNPAEMDNNYAEICDDTIGIVDIAATVIPC